PRPTLAGEADALAVANTGRDVDLVVAPVGERDLTPAPVGRLLEREVDDPLEVAAAHLESVEPAAGPRPGATEEALEEVAEVAHIAAAKLEVPPLAVAQTLQTHAPRRAADVVARLPVGAEPVVALALLGVAQDLVGLG